MQEINNLEQESLDSPLSTEEQPTHPGEGGIFNFPAHADGQGPVRLTSLNPVSPSHDEVYSNTDLRATPQPALSVGPTREGGAKYVSNQHSLTPSLG